LPDVRERATIDVTRDEAWRFLLNIRNWASLFPGYQGIQILNDDDSLWRVKGDVGILTKLVTFRCHVTRWVEEEYVEFQLDCVEEKVSGFGNVSVAANAGTTELELFLSFNGAGMLGPVVNALLRKVLPKMTSDFSASLKSKMELVGSSA
jgi:carbon monoxide dehydrogenase subunit G